MLFVPLHSGARIKLVAALFMVVKPKLKVVLYLKLAITCNGMDVNLFTSHRGTYERYMCHTICMIWNGSLSILCGEQNFIAFCISNQNSNIS